MALTKKEIKTTKPRAVFTITGKVTKLTETAFLLVRSNSQTQYWIDLNGRKRCPKEGDLIECDTTISSYIGKKDSVFLNKLRFLDYRLIPQEPDRESPSFFYRKLGDTEIVDIITCREIEGLHILKVKSLETNEIFYIRYYQGQEESPSLGRARLSLNLTTLTSVIGTDGITYEDKRNIEYKDRDGNTVAKTVWIWYPTLVATNLFKIDEDTHGAGGNTENIQ